MKKIHEFLISNLTLNINCLYTNLTVTKIENNKNE